MKKIMKKITKKKFGEQGVSLMELMVAVSIFIIVISIAIGSFVQSIRTQRTALALISANDSINLSIEQMAREIRTGYLFCTASVPVTSSTASCNVLENDAFGDHELQFVNANGFTVRYRLNGANFALEKGIVDSVCLGGLLSPEGFCYKPITADNVKVSIFIVKLIHGGDLPEANPYPPRVTLIMAVTSKEPDVESLNIFTDIEMSISPRCGQNGCPSDI